MKRVIDVAASATLSVVLLPVFALVAAVVYLRLGRPILFRDRRIGLNGVPFTLYKFRTMTFAAEPDGSLMSDSARLDRFGAVLRQLSLDELPQLWNVLTGSMSLVGPRPLLPRYMDRYNARQRRRHEVKPGITGWAQVNGRNTVTWQQKLEYDVWYVDNSSCLLDVKILFLTLITVATREGISQPGQATMSEFRGTLR